MISGGISDFIMEAATKKGCGLWISYIDII